MSVIAQHSGTVTFHLVCKGPGALRPDMDSETRQKAYEALRENGYWVVADEAVGARVDSIVREGFKLQTIEALDAYQATVLDDEVSAAHPLPEAVRTYSLIGCPRYCERQSRRTCTWSLSCLWPDEKIPLLLKQHIRPTP